jgi:polysaccharide export outer membrane protein
MRFKCLRDLLLGLVLISTLVRTAEGQDIPSVVVSATRAPSYSLRPGDAIRLRIWREPDLSGEFPVDEYGRVNFPLIGTYPVADETRESLHQKLVGAFAKSVENLSMDVIFIRRVPVVGAVRSPGLFAIDPTMTVGDAVALAGGATVDLTRAKILLMRSGKAVISDVDPALLVSSLPIERGDQLYIPPQDGFFVRNPWVIGTVIQSLVTLTAAILTISRR